MYLTQRGSPKQMFVLLRQLRPPVEAATSDSEATRGSHLAPPWIAGMGECSRASPTVCGQDFLNRRGWGVGGIMECFPLLVSISQSACLSFSTQLLVCGCLLCSQAETLLPQGTARQMSLRRNSHRSKRIPRRSVWRGSQELRG